MNSHLKLKNKIRELRTQKGLSQTELAKMAGTTQNTISSLETGRYNPSILLAHKIASFFGLTIEDVFVFEEE